VSAAETSEDTLCTETTSSNEGTWAYFESQMKRIVCIHGRVAHCTKQTVNYVRRALYAWDA